ncbi:type II secretion system protein, partial [Candidatus Peregrinibacteria bacterium]|nr:type II secretion system protein [Candidatus Peregrinibacteria bacterium]
MIKSRLQKERSGYTLIELILVMVVIGVLTVSAVSGILRSRRILTFNAADQQVGSLVREARSLAVTGKAILDYGDYDNDGLDNGDNDYVTPAHYGVHFD